MELGKQTGVRKKGQKVSAFSEGDKSVEAVTKYAEGLGLKCHHIDDRLSCAEIKDIPGKFLSIYILVVEAETKEGKIVSPMTYEIAVD